VAPTVHAGAGATDVVVVVALVGVLVVGTVVVGTVVVGTVLLVADGWVAGAGTARGGGCWHPAPANPSAHITATANQARDARSARTFSG
jgi:hypothetical protein